MEFLLINHPLDCLCVIKVESTNSRYMSVGYGPMKSRYTEEKHLSFTGVGPLISVTK